MPKASPLQANFLGGEISPFAFGRVDTDRYKVAVEKCENYIPLLQGGVGRRPGTRFVAETKYANKTTILVRFEFSTTQAYILEFGDLYVRFYADNGQVALADQNITAISNAAQCVVTYDGSDTYANGDEVFISGIVGPIGTFLNNRNFIVSDVDTGANTFKIKYRNGTYVDSTAMGLYTSGGTVAEIYEVTTTYTETQLETMAFTQSADVLYIVHKDHPPRKLIRSGATSWALSAISFLDGPYLPINSSATTFTPSHSTNLNITITASVATFASTDVGRLIRFSPDGTNWYWMTITAFTDSTHVDVTRASATAIGTSARLTWRLGLWSATTGYPTAITFHEDRLCFGGAAGAPQEFDMSVSRDYENMAPTLADGTTTDALAVSRQFNSKDVNSIFWMETEERALLAGTASGEWSVRPAVNSEPIGPENVNARQISNHGSARIQPVIAGKSVMFVQGSTRIMRELSYFYEIDGFRAPDRTIAADHISGADGFKQICRQKERPSIVWATRNDGVLAGMTYEREEDSLIISWHRHILGGSSDAAGSAALVKWGAVIPSVGGKRDDLWLVVRRYVDGEVKQYVEYLSKLFEHEDEQRDAFHVDSGLTYDNPVAISAVTKANPCVVTSNSHGLSNGDVVRFDDVYGMTELNGNSYTVRNKAANTFELEKMNGSALNSTAFNTYVSGGYFRKFVTTITGLWHLEGESVDLWADGAIQPEQTVEDGAITLQDRAATIQIGLAYRSRGKMLRLEAGAADGTALGKNRRVHKVGFLLHRTLGFKFGMDFDSMEEIVFRRSDDEDGRAPELFSGIKSVEMGADYDFENQICFEQSRPAPGTVLAVMPQLEVQDRG